jgi:hypothetical protein
MGSCNGMKDLLSANVFSGFSSWKSIVYAGERTPKILRFEVTPAEGDSRFLYLISIISKEEKMAWQSFQDVLERMTMLAQNNMRGFFGFDVLSVDIQTGIRNFNPNDLGRLIVNHSKELGPDQKALIRYGQLFALLHYRAPADWGKIEVKTHVEFFSQEPASAEVTEASVMAALRGSGSRNKNSSGDQMDLLLKKLLKESGQEPSAIYILHDLSVHSIWDPANKVQQERVCLWLEKEKQAHGGGLPEIYYCHTGKCTPIKV